MEMKKEGKEIINKWELNWFLIRVESYSSSPVAFKTCREPVEKLLEH